MEAPEQIDPTPIQEAAADAMRKVDPPSQPQKLADVVALQLRERGVKLSCAACRMVGMAAFEINPVPADRPTVVPPMVMREVSLICMRCGLTMLFNLNVLGIGIQQEQRRVITPDQIRQQAQPLIVPA